MNHKIILIGLFLLPTLAASQDSSPSASKHFSLSYPFKTAFKGVKEAFSSPSSKMNTIKATPVSDLTPSHSGKKVTNTPPVNLSQINFFQEIIADSESEIYKAYKNLPVSWQEEAVINRILQQAAEISQYPQFTGPALIELLAAYGIDAAEKNRFYGLSREQYGYEKDISSAHAGLQHAFLQGKEWAKETLYEAYSHGWYGYEQNIEEAKNLLKEPSSNTTHPSPSHRKHSKKRKELIIPLDSSHATQYKLVCKHFGLPVE